MLTLPSPTIRRSGSLVFSDDRTVIGGAVRKRALENDFVWTDPGNEIYDEIIGDLASVGAYPDAALEANRHLGCEKRVDILEATITRLRAGRHFLHLEPVVADGGH